MKSLSANKLFLQIQLRSQTRIFPWGGRIEIISETYLKKPSKPITVSQY